jgi:acyl dehydratase
VNATLGSLDGTVAIGPFADATDYHQSIHVDVGGAKTGLFGGRIAHGYLTLSLLFPLWSEMLVIEELDMAVNSLADVSDGLRRGLAPVAEQGRVTP